MNISRILVITAALLLATQAPAACAELLVDNAWVRGLPPGVTATAAYMTLTNTGAQALVLTGATSPIAGSVALHSSMNHGGMLHMMPLESATIPAGGELLLESGGSHLMLTELKEQPVPGQTVELTLQFADGSSRMLQLPVRSVLDE